MCSGCQVCAEDRSTIKHGVLRMLATLFLDLEASPMSVISEATHAI